MGRLERSESRAVTGGPAIGLVCVILAAAIVYLLAISWADDGPGEE